MADLVIGRIDKDEAVANVVAVIRKELPGATNLVAGVDGDTEPRSFARGVAGELAGRVGLGRGVAFRVTVDADSPRPLRVRCDFMPVGRGAAVVTLLSLVRLRHVVPGEAVYRRVRFRTSALEGDENLRAPLAARPGLDKLVGRFLKGAAPLGGGTMITIDPFVRLVPDPDGALLMSYNTPRLKQVIFGERTLDLGAFLEIAESIEAATAAIPDASAAALPAVPLPG